LDLGAYSVKLLRLEAGKQHLKFEVIDALEEVLPSAHVDGPDLLERQREVVARFLQAGLLENEGAAVALSAADGQMRLMSMPFSDSRKIEAILPGLIEAEVPFELSDMTVAWHRQESALVSAENKDETKIRLAFGRKQSIAALLHMLQPMAFDPRLLLLGSSALYELVRHVGYKPFAAHDTPTHTHMSALIDLGHRATNLCVFDHQGLVFTRSFMQGGEKLTQDIAQAFNISFEEAQLLKHEKLNFLHSPADEKEEKIQQLGVAHYLELAERITRIFIASKTSGYEPIGSVALVGGAAKPAGLDKIFADSFKAVGCHLVSLKPLVPHKVHMPSMALAYSLALSGVHTHAKDSRFNFRKDEFAWRGEFDFLRTKSSPLILWALTLVCALGLMWSASSLVLDKENKAIDAQLKATCMKILGKGDIPAKKCLAMMKEQISARAEVEIPAFTAADAYLKAAQGLPKDLALTVSELDIAIATSDKEKGKIRLTAESPSYADIDNVVANWSKIPCFIEVENTGAQPVGGQVKYTISNKIDCQAVRAPAVPATSAPAANPGSAPKRR
jgi:general secretion pathway protein L